MFPSFLRSRWWDTPTPLYRASICDAAGPWTDLRLEEDWEYDCRIAALGTRLHFCEAYVAEVRDHDQGRLCRGDALDPARLSFRTRAHRLILEHATRAGIAAEVPEMQHFARELFLLARQCGAAGSRRRVARVVPACQDCIGSRQGGWARFPAVPDRGGHPRLVARRASCVRHGSAAEMTREPAGFGRDERVQRCRANCATRFKACSSQEDVEFELIVVNDGSNDASARLLDEFSAADTRVRVIHQDNRGLTRALIRGLRGLRGENIIARQDCGDLSLPGRLRDELRAMESRSGAALVSCGTRFVGPRGEVLYEVAVQRGRCDGRVADAPPAAAARAIASRQHLVSA